MTRLTAVGFVTTLLAFGCSSSSDPGTSGGSAGGGAANAGHGGTSNSGGGSGYLECDITVLVTPLPSMRTYTKHECIEQNYPPAFPEVAEDTCREGEESGEVTKTESTTEHCDTEPTTPSTSCIGINAGGNIISRWNYDIFTSIDPAATGATLANAKQQLVGLYGAACVFGGVFKTYNIDDGSSTVVAGAASGGGAGDGP